MAARLTVCVGVIHLLATVPSVIAAAPFVLARGVLGGIATTVPLPADATAPLSALFSVLLSVQLFLVAGLVQRLEDAGLPAPRWLGATFLVGGLVGGVLLPPSGFWLLAALGAWLLGVGGSLPGKV